MVDPHASSKPPLELVWKGFRVVVLSCKRPDCPTYGDGYKGHCRGVGA
jgi:hypothetical protein